MVLKGELVHEWNFGICICFSMCLNAMLGNVNVASFNERFFWQESWNLSSTLKASLFKCSCIILSRVLNGTDIREMERISQFFWGTFVSHRNNGGSFSYAGMCSCPQHLNMVVYTGDSYREYCKSSVPSVTHTIWAFGDTIWSFGFPNVQ